VGCNLQNGNWVWGIEGDLGWAGVRGSHNEISPGNPALPAHVKQNWLGTARGRVGYAANNLLIYATGGFGGWGFRLGIDATSVPGFFFIEDRKTQVGWVVGGGLEYGLTPNWSIKAEYLYADFGDIKFYNPPPAGFAARLAPVTESIVRAGINYRWGGPVVARY
jgi:outer membrane immunogenic protein